MRIIVYICLLLCLPILCHAQARFAEVDGTGTVIRVILVPDTEAQTDADGQSFCQRMTNSKNLWVRTYKAIIGVPSNQCAGVGMKYNATLKRFEQAQPFPSWVMDADGIWQPPVVKPQDGRMYRWDETEHTWTVREWN